ncbi:hypothetical protein [Paenibacillus bouchesdurhonensis]|uniref:hypothetical protein n=1 Tax=Paenibacillus bouchesdurhonensis TaxID=1870990 RepID=UPI001900C945|nr:hypothetical protein [Paenibacillus bouchesdurhonensis]
MLMVAWVLFITQSLASLINVIGLFCEDDAKGRVKIGVNLLFSGMLVWFFINYLFY